MKLGIALGRLYPTYYERVTLEADRLGFESVWLPEHLVLPVDVAGSPFAGADHPPVPSNAPVYDCFGYLNYLAGVTSRVRLGSHVYLLGLRHPFVSARAIQTLDLVSGGRAEIGVGAGWLLSEWTATGMDPRTRGRRLDEAIEICKRLWSDDVIEHHGEFYDFEPVQFEPKPVQKPHPPILIGGESPPALRRAARVGNGWVGLDHTPDSCAEPIAKLAQLRAQYGREDEPFELVCTGRIENLDDVRRWEDAGITRLIVAPWDRSRGAIDGMRRLAEQVFE
ncbi:MAG TPA: LLM class F420-dependent oxidoreductase [Deltaproteobacteria bacterium]|nr:LLM class F420-dependent oxidoreductase [Candidatus Binatota bacterium]HIL14078.1 LLM class F420-dependent oxidoreductase [Deltaproteobacteria bacterium]